MGTEVWLNNAPHLATLLPLMIHLRRWDIDLTWSTWNNETIIHISYLTMSNKIKYLFFGEFILNIPIMLRPRLSRLDLVIVPNSIWRRNQILVLILPCVKRHSLGWCWCGVLIAAQCYHVLSSPRCCFLCCHSHGSDTLNKRETSQVLTSLSLWQRNSADERWYWWCTSKFILRHSIYTTFIFIYLYGHQLSVDPQIICFTIIIIQSLWKWLYIASLLYNQQFSTLGNEWLSMTFSNKHIWECAI